MRIHICSIKLYIHAILSLMIIAVFGNIIEYKDTSFSRAVLNWAGMAGLGSSAEFGVQPALGLSGQIQQWSNPDGPKGGGGT